MSEERNTILPTQADAPKDPTSEPSSPQACASTEDKGPTIGKWTIGTWKDVAAAVQSIATVIAVIIAGIWTVGNFRLQRLDAPHMKISQVVTGKLLSPKWYWLRNSITTDNVGTSKIGISTIDIKIQQILPLPHSASESNLKFKRMMPADDVRIDWPIICRYARPFEVVIEPGESDTNDVDFIVPAWLKTLRVYAYLDNKFNTGYGWHAATIYNVTGANDAETTKNMAEDVPDDNNDSICSHDNKQ